MARFTQRPQEDAMKELLETAMIVAFGIAWPTAIAKSLKARTAAGKSLFFLLIVLAGYAFGIASKLVAGALTYVFLFYAINFVMVSFDILLYIRNRRLDRARAAAKPD
jgi:hypothetical protein